ncbi:hypothetical protein AY599_21230 [Leptolyngbya valderiana BDU 20041]|nr:hypothetical protein AY599_21230 [Leptolyngbya valderiana BDU 20041]
MDAEERHRHESALARLERFSYWTDNNFGIPFTRFRIGVGPLIGLIPGIGDLVDLLMSLWVVNEARRIGAQKTLLLRMLGHLVIDFLGGLLPIVGDVFDAFYKANTRNTALLKGYLEGQLGQAGPGFPWGKLVLAVLLAGLAVTLGVILL